jgi:predicted nucleotidyltransferase
MNFDEFNVALTEIENDDGLLDFCRKWVLHGTPHIFQEREDEFYEFRKRIADGLHVSFHEVFITGSAKLGFSPHKGTEFSYDSDIDVAIISPDLFESVMGHIYKFQVDLRRSRRAVDERELAMYHEFLEYVAIGWIRPDKLPLSFKIKELKTSWFEFFNSLSYGRSEVGDYKVTGGVFKGYYYLEQYIVSGLRSARSTAMVELNK